MSSVLDREWSPLLGAAIGIAAWVGAATAVSLPAVPWLLLYATAGFLLILVARYLTGSPTERDAGPVRRTIDGALLTAVLLVIALRLLGTL